MYYLVEQWMLQDITKYYINIKYLGFSILTRDEAVPLKSWLFVRYSTDPSNFK